MTRSFVIKAGATALDSIRAQGFDQSMFSTLVGASGGPKWLVLSHLDRLLAGEFFSGRQAPIMTTGTSIGSWRMVCYAQDDPVKAIERLEHGYIEQSYSAKPSAREVTAGATKILERILPQENIDQVINNTVWKTHILAVRSLGLNASDKRGPLSAGLLFTALANTVSRRTLDYFFRRTIFHAGASNQLDFSNLKSDAQVLTHDNIRPAILASGSIPLVMEGVKIEHSASGDESQSCAIYRDGGITDYHYDMAFGSHDGLILYPHFYDFLVPGWFDKFLPWRKLSPEALDKVVLIAPSPQFVAELPYKKIPDRKDFATLSEAERKKAWRSVVSASKRIADEFHDLVEKQQLHQIVESF